MTRKPLKSRSVRVVLAGATALSLAACNEEKVDEASIFPNLETCLAETEKPGSWYTPEECRAAFAAAEAEHTRTAPHYADRALCEEQHGGACEIQQDSSGGPSSYP